jgi:hypothetical protein
MSRPRTARELALATSRSQRKLRLENERANEEAARSAPVRGEVVGRNPQTGLDILRTPDGGQIEAENLGGSAPLGPVPIQRSPGSERASFATPPTPAVDVSALLVENQQLWALVDQLRNDQGSLIIMTPKNRTYPLIPYVHIPLTILSIKPGWPNEAWFESGSGNVSFSHNELDSLAVGDRFSVTFSGLSTDGGDPPEITASVFAVSVKFKVA